MLDAQTLSDYRTEVSTKGTFYQVQVTRTQAHHILSLLDEIEELHQRLEAAKDVYTDLLKKAQKPAAKAPTTTTTTKPRTTRKKAG